MSNVKRISNGEYEIAHEGVFYPITVANRTFDQYAGQRAALLTANLTTDGSRCCQILLAPTITPEALAANIIEISEAFAESGVENVQSYLGFVSDDGSTLHGLDGTDYTIVEQDSTQVWVDTDGDEIIGVNIKTPGLDAIKLPCLGPCSLAKLKNAVVLLVAAEERCVSPHTVFDLGEDMSAEHELFDLYYQAFVHFVAMMNAADAEAPYRFCMVHVDEVTDKGNETELSLTNYVYDTKIKFSIPKAN